MSLVLSLFSLWCAKKIYPSHLVSPPCSTFWGQSNDEYWNLEEVLKQMSFKMMTDND